ncbi:hypothetical protein ACJX0J_039324 [Zea mays]
MIWHNCISKRTILVMSYGRPNLTSMQVTHKYRRHPIDFYVSLVNDEFVLNESGDAALWMHQDEKENQTKGAFCQCSREENKRKHDWFITCEATERYWFEQGLSSFIIIVDVVLIFSKNRPFLDY